MAKALMGSFGTPKTLQLLEEINALRARIRELEEALEAAQQALAVAQARAAATADVVDLEAAETVKA